MQQMVSWDVVHTVHIVLVLVLITVPDFSVYQLIIVRFSDICTINQYMCDIIPVIWKTAKKQISMFEHWSCNYINETQ